LKHGEYSVSDGLGERTCEGNDVYHEIMASGAIKKNKALDSKAVFTDVLVLDEEGQDDLLYADDIFRFMQAGSEVSAG
jgi:F-type H+-transporting ATPase subunit beta